MDNEESLEIQITTIDEEEKTLMPVKSMGSEEDLLEVKTIGSHEDMAESAGLVKVEADCGPVEIPATSVSRKQYQCSLCQLTFSKRWNCVSHMRAHSRERVVLHCPMCGKPCSKQSELDTHLRIHTGEKPYVCPECQRCFVRRGQLNAHLRVHTGDKPHMCDDCGAFFASGSNLKRHQQSHTESLGQRIKGRSVRRVKKENVEESAARRAGQVKEESVEEGGTERKSGERGPFPTRVVISRHNSPALHNIIHFTNTQPGVSGQQADRARSHSSVATNTDYDITTSPAAGKTPKPAEKHSAVAAPSSASQPTPEPITRVPAMSTHNSFFVLDPVVENILKEKRIEVMEGAVVTADTDGHQIHVLPGNDAGSAEMEAAHGSAFAGETSEGVGGVTLVAETEASNGALSSVMQMDWSFLLEGPGLTAQPQSPEPLPHSLIPVTTSAIRLTEPSNPSVSQMSDTTVLVNDATFRLSDPVVLADSTAVQLSGPLTQMSGSAAFQLSDSGVPVMVPIPHIPAIDLNQFQQDVAQVAPPSSGPITLLVEQLNADGYQVLQDITVDSVSDGTQLLLNGQSLPRQHTITFLPHNTHGLLDISDTVNTTNNNSNNNSNINSSDNKEIPEPEKVQVKPYVCDLCKQAFSRKWYLTVHRAAHLRQTTYPCDQCSARFSRVGNLNRHKATHTGAKPFQCSQCPSRFGSRYRLVEHERRHEGVKPYRCETCGSYFSDCSSLKRHQAAHRGDNLQHTCDFCGAQFRTLHSLTFHLKQHIAEETGCVEKGVTLDENESTPRDIPMVTVDQSQVEEAGQERPCVLRCVTEGEGVRFACSVCGRGFAVSAACRQHLLSHTGSRPYRCTDCGAKFSRKADAKRHTATHTRHKRHLCAHCGERFQTRSRLVLHGDAHLPAESLVVPCGECRQVFSKERVVQIHRQIFHRRQLKLYRPTSGDGCGTSGDGCGTSGDGCGTSGDGCGTSGDGCGTSGDGCGTSGDGCGTSGDGCGMSGDGCGMSGDGCGTSGDGCGTSGDRGGMEVEEGEGEEVGEGGAGSGKEGKGVDGQSESEEKSGNVSNGNLGADNTEGAEENGQTVMKDTNSEETNVACSSQSNSSSTEKQVASSHHSPHLNSLSAQCENTTAQCVRVTHKPPTTPDASTLQEEGRVAAVPSTLRDVTRPQRASARRQRDLIASLTSKKHSRKPVRLSM